MWLCSLYRVQRDLSETGMPPWLTWVIIAIVFIAAAYLKHLVIEKGWVLPIAVIIGILCLICAICF